MLRVNGSDQYINDTQVDSVRPLLGEFWNGSLSWTTTAGSNTTIFFVGTSFTLSNHSINHCWCRHGYLGVRYSGGRSGIIYRHIGQHHYWAIYRKRESGGLSQALVRGTWIAGRTVALPDLE